MDQSSVVNNALRDLKFRDIIKECDSDQAKIVLDGIWTSGYEYQKEKDRKDRQGTARKVTYYGQNDEPLGTYESVTKASNELVIPRKTIYNTLSGKYKAMRNGHYFRYTDNGDNKPE
jgi:hypothetical protein